MPYVTREELSSAFKDLEARWLMLGVIIGFIGVLGFLESRAHIMRDEILRTRIDYICEHVPDCSVMP